MRKLLPLFLGGLALSLVLFSCKDATSDTPAAEPDPVLSGLSLSAGTLNPAFNKDTTSYSSAVSNSVTSVTVTAETNDSSLTITVNGTGAASGAATAVPLAVGDTLVRIVVSNGSDAKTYTIVVARAGTPEINLKGPAVYEGTVGNLSSGTSIDFGTVDYSEETYNDITFTIENSGDGPLSLSGTSPYVVLSGDYPDYYSVPTQPAPTIPAGGSTTFVIRFSAIAGPDEYRGAVLTITSDDEDEGTITLALNGYASS